MNFIERVMRVMTHINIGAALGLAAWLLWTGWQVVTGQIAPAHSAAKVKALVSLAHAGPSVGVELLPVQGHGGTPPPCLEPLPAIRRADRVLTGADL